MDAVYIVESKHGGKISKDGEKIIDSAIAAFDELIAKVNANNVEDKKAHFRGIRQELEEKAGDLVAQVNALSD